MIPRTNVRDKTPMVVDPTTQALITVDFDHHELHSGNLYTAQYAPLNVAAGATASMHLVTPPGSLYVYAHTVFSASTELGATVRILERPVVTVQGTPVVRQNHNRDTQVDKPSQMLVFSQPTYNGGVALVGDVVGTSGGQSIGGNTRSQAEFILARGTSYVLEATNNGAQPSDMVLTALWYEHGFGYDDET
jgi:hypothetical protein